MKGWWRTGAGRDGAKVENTKWGAHAVVVYVRNDEEGICCGGCWDKGRNNKSLAYFESIGLWLMMRVAHNPSGGKKS